LELKRELSYFDLVNIVIGASIGSDIYIIPGLVAGLIGPFAISIWILDGAAAMVLATVFGYCSYYVPDVGGSFAYATRAFNKFWGFITGWSMSIAEIVALPVFAIVFTNYLEYFVPLSYPEELAVRAIFIISLVAVNVVGAKAAGRLNDVLTLAKLTPLALIIFLGIGSILFRPSLLSNYAPPEPYGLGNLGTVVILIFWAYAGFELGTLPSSEVVDPKKNVPRAMITGMLIVIFFYVLTNIAVFGVVNWADLSKSSVPLVLVSVALLGLAGAVITTFGALASVSGTDETEVLGAARLIYAMSKDGLLPKATGKVHPRFKTPYVAVIIQGVVALVLMPFSAISDLISFAVFNLAICYLLVSISLAFLRKKGEMGLRGESVLPWLGAIVSLYLIYSSALSDILVGTAVVLLGIPVYVYFAKKGEPGGTRGLLAEQEGVLVKDLARRKRLLADLVRFIRRRLGTRESS
jgi:amino acid transporter